MSILKNPKRFNYKFILLSLFTVLVVFLVVAYAFILRPEDNHPTEVKSFVPEISKTDAEWKAVLSPQQYYVLRQKGTDVPFSDIEMPLLNEHRKGTFVTADCGEPVFRSETKFDSGTGWPSFYEPIKDSVVEISDFDLGIERTEDVGKKCGGHLGHVFRDGPAPTGLRYCINASALKFIPDPE